MNILDTISATIFAQDATTGFHIGIVVFVLLTIRAIIMLNKTSELYKFFVNTKLTNTEISQVYTKILNKKRNTFLKLKKHSKF